MMVDERDDEAYAQGYAAGVALGHKAALVNIVASVPALYPWIYAMKAPTKWAKSKRVAYEAKSGRQGFNEFNAMVTLCLDRPNIHHDEIADAAQKALAQFAAMAKDNELTDKQALIFIRLTSALLAAYFNHPVDVLDNVARALRLVTEYFRAPQTKAKTRGKKSKIQQRNDLIRAMYQERKKEVPNLSGEDFAARLEGTQKGKDDPVYMQLRAQLHKVPATVTLIKILRSEI